MSGEKSEKGNKSFKRYVSFIIVLLTLILWIYNSNQYLHKTNLLCNKGVQTNGIITSIKLNNLNEGNITSWDVFYYFKVKDYKYFGNTNLREKPLKNQGDSIKVLYSKCNPNIHNVFMDRINNECITYGKALIKNYYYLIIGLVLLLAINIKGDEN